MSGCRHGGRDVPMKRAVERPASELEAERDYYKEQFAQCLSFIIKQERGRNFDALMSYPRPEGYIEPFQLVTDEISSLRDFNAELTRERDYWRSECADMLGEFWDTESEHCAMLDYPRPASECAPSILVKASRMGRDERERLDAVRIAELESLVRDMYSYAVNREVELCNACTDANGDFADCAACGEYDGACGIVKRRFEELYAGRMAELAIEGEA